MKIRMFDRDGKLSISEQHIDAEIPGSIRVLIDESAHPQEVVTGLLRIANQIDREFRLATDPNNNWLKEGEDMP